MAYQAKRRPLYTEVFELVDKYGSTAHTLHVSLDADTVVRKLSEKHAALVSVMQDIQQLSGDTQNQLVILGNAVTDIMEAVFGSEDTKIILDFYDSRYVEMCQEVIPFVTTVAIPKIREMAQANKKEIAAGYSRNRRLSRRK